jgi:hypothetical protein
MKRTALKRNQQPLKRGRKPLPKFSRRALARDPTEKKRIITEHNDFFIKIWNILRDYQRVCYETGERLYPDPDGFPYTSYFHHVLSKEVWPQFQFSAWNIILVSLATHSQCETSVRLCPKIYALTQDFQSRWRSFEP